MWPETPERGLGYSSTPGRHDRSQQGQDWEPHSADRVTETQGGCVIGASTTETLNFRPTALSALLSQLQPWEARCQSLVGSRTWLEAQSAEAKGELSDLNLKRQASLGSGPG